MKVGMTVMFITHKEIGSLKFLEFYKVIEIIPKVCRSCGGDVVRVDGMDEGKYLCDSNFIPASNVVDKFKELKDRQLLTDVDFE